MTSVMSKLPRAGEAPGRGSVPSGGDEAGLLEASAASSPSRSVGGPEAAAIASGSSTDESPAEEPTVALSSAPSGSALANPASLVCRPSCGRLDVATPLELGGTFEGAGPGAPVPEASMFSSSLGGASTAAPLGIDQPGSPSAPPCAQPTTEDARHERETRTARVATWTERRDFLS